jgi:Uma2 family endonuclease
MTAMPHDPPFVRDDLRDAFASLDVLPGFRAELVDGEIIVSPTPDGQHETIIVAIDDWVRETHGLRLHSNLTLICPEGEYVPDGIVAPKGAFAGREWHSKPDGVVMVLEVTERRADERAEWSAFDRAAPFRAGRGASEEGSATISSAGDRRRVRSAERDRGPKRTGYAAAGIPLYLLVDRLDGLDGRVTIFSEPRGGDYHRSAAVMIGDQLAIPAPLEGVLDTQELR